MLLSIIVDQRKDWDMFRELPKIALAAMLLGVGSFSWAHPGHDHFDGKPPGAQVWKETDGLFELEAFLSWPRMNGSC